MITKRLLMNSAGILLVLSMVIPAGSTVTVRGETAGTVIAPSEAIFASEKDEPSEPSDPSEPRDPSGPSEQEKKVSAFVERLYTIALERESDPEGLAFWTGQLTSQTMSGADCVRNFLLGAPEFLDRGLTYGEILDVLYAGIMDRTADEGGKAFWEEQLKKGDSVDSVILRFIDSPEWCNICASYGIRSGAVTAKATRSTEASWNYSGQVLKALFNREGTTEELSLYSLQLTNLELTASQMISTLFTGEKGKALALSDTEYMTRLYRACFLHDGDAEGIAFWAGQLTEKKTNRYQVICTLTETEDFAAVCKEYGIDAGALDRTKDPYAPKRYVEPVIAGGPKWYDGYVDPRTVRAELIENPSDITILCNKYYSVPLDYVPELVSVKYSKGQMLRPEAAAAWEKMHDACLRATGVSLYLVSGYRSQDTQRNSFYRCISNKGIRHACAYYAWPGRSEHPLGLGLDIGTSSHPSISKSFVYTTAGQWVLAHGHEYGFIWRYPNGCGNITGIAEEGWHFRYIGVEIATEMHERGIRTLEEYYGKPQ